MSEIIPNQTPVEAVPEIGAATFFETKIDLAIDAYIQNCLGPEERADVLAQHDRGDRVNTICWHLAKTQRPDCVRKAINLRSFDILRMIDEKSSSLPNGEDWEYHMATVDPFWDGVDKAVMSFMKDNAESFRVSNSPREVIQGGDVFIVEQKIAMFNEKKVYRKTYSSSLEGAPHHVIYSVGH